MRAQLLNRLKILTALATVGLALMITGWTMASKAYPEPVATPPAPVQTAAAHPTTEKKIQNALAKHSKLKGEKIQVKSADGKYNLTGTISKADKRAVAIQVAEKIAGKGNVVDNLNQPCGAAGSCSSGFHCCDCLPNKPQACQCVPNSQSCDATSSKKTK